MYGRLDHFLNEVQHVTFEVEFQEMAALMMFFNLHNFDFTKKRQGEGHAIANLKVRKVITVDNHSSHFAISQQRQGLIINKPCHTIFPALPQLVKHI